MNLSVCVCVCVCDYVLIRSVSTVHYIHLQYNDVCMCQCVRGIITDIYGQQIRNSIYVYHVVFVRDVIWIGNMLVSRSVCVLFL